MREDYTNIKVVGFDLDQTLYPKSSEIDEVIQEYIYKKIAEHKKVSITESKKLFKDLYKNGNGLSGRKTLIELEIPNAAEIIQEALENANIASVLKQDLFINLLLKDLKKEYINLDIVTGSSDKQAKRKLEVLSIPKNLFNHIIVDEHASKSDGQAYKLWMSYYEELNPENFLYIGDRASTDHEAPSYLGIKTILVNIKEPNESINAPQLKTFLELREYLL